MTMQPGPQNAITDVPGVLVGQVERVDAPYLTGTTVVHLPTTAVAGVDVRGGAPGTRETDLLEPVNSNAGSERDRADRRQRVRPGHGRQRDALARGRGEGVRVGQGDQDVVPIVPTAVIFDLGRGGDFRARPEPDWGAEAIAVATDGAVALGNMVPAPARGPDRSRAASARRASGWMTVRRSARW
jgi:putative pantetheine hydrolase